MKRKVSQDFDWRRIGSARDWRRLWHYCRYCQGFREEVQTNYHSDGTQPPSGAGRSETLALRSSAELKKFLIESMRARDPKTKPVEIERALTRILRDREIADNLAAMRDAGARVEYHSIDLRDEGGFSQLIQSIYARHGRIDGVLHGAGVIDDKLIKDKQVESFDNVFSTKVIPATVLVKI